MYNEELKKRFIRDYTTSINTAKICETTFNACEPYELEWGADLCTKTEDELQPVIDNIVGLRVRSQFMRIILLKDYVRWCNEVVGFPKACLGMLDIKVAGVDKVKSQLVSTPLQLQQYLDILFASESELTVDNAYRCFYWMAYAGLTEADALQVQESDVDLENLIIKFNDTEYPIYREALKSFRNCVKESQFMYFHPNYEPVARDRACGTQLIRGLRGQQTSNSMRVNMSKASKLHEDDTNLRLSYKRIWLSGVFYRMHEKELSGMEPNFYPIVAEQRKGKTYKLDSGRNTNEAKLKQLARDYMKDYARWKLAYRM